MILNDLNGTSNGKATKMSRVKVSGVPDTLEPLKNKTIRELKFNILYIDLNSCFATTEQQARPKLRNKPVAVVNRIAEHATIIAASIEAKELGIKVGMRIEEAKNIYNKLILVETEPSKYIFVHNKLKSIMKSYSPKIVMKSIDEGLIDLSEADNSVKDMTPYNLAIEIKARLNKEIGSYMKCNIGFSYNRFLAKMAGELHKPNGADAITYDNIREVFSHLKLTDLPGINKKTEKRLKTYNIDTPVKLLDASEETLRKQVLKSKEGTKWYFRLRGAEVDERDDITKSIGRQFVLPPKCSLDNIKIRLAHLAEDVGYRLRVQELYAYGMYVWVGVNMNENHFGLHKNILKKDAFSTDQEIIEISSKLFNEIINELKKNNQSLNIRIMGITLYNLSLSSGQQITLTYEQDERRRKIADAVDKINQRFGQRTVHSAYTLGTEDMRVKIPFGSTRYLAEGSSDDMV